MKKTLLILLFLATYIFANNDLLELNYEDSKRIYSYLEKFENKKIEEELKRIKCKCNFIKLKKS